MQDWEKIGEELKKSGRSGELNALAASADGQKLGRMVDAQALAEAARTGNTAALREAAGRLMATAEGQRMRAALQKLLQENGRG